MMSPRQKISRDSLGFDIVEHHFQGFEVSVNITDQSAAHLRETSARKWLGIAKACQIVNPSQTATTLGKESSPI